ncbi:MAG: hypothetical protein ABW318_27025 [Vicinamibacterales bacterium]
MERIVMVVMHPRERVWDALCERTCELAPYLEHIEKAELKSRESTPRGLVRCVHVWRARANVPAILAHHIDNGLLEWTARTEWRANSYESRWVVEPRSMKDSALCEGTMRFSPAVGGKGTRIDLDLTLVFAQPTAGLQTLTSTILSTHFRKLVDAASRLIDDK